MRALILAATLALAACIPDANKASQAKPEPAPAELAFQPPAVVFEALSANAKTATGAVSLSVIPRTDPNAPPAMKIAAATGLTYETELVPGGAEQATAIDWKSIFQADAVTSANPPPFAPSIDLHAIKLETAPTGDGLCGKDKTTHIAMATRLVVSGADTMSLAAFKGDAWPPKDKSALCAIFSYTPPAPPS